MRSSVKGRSMRRTSIQRLGRVPVKVLEDFESYCQRVATCSCPFLAPLSNKAQ